MRTRTTTRTTALAAIALLLLTFQSFGMLVGSSPSVFAPSCMPLVSVAEYYGPVAVLGLCLPTVLFVLWALVITRTQRPGSIRLPALLLIVLLVGLVSLTWYYLAWRGGVQYQGLEHVRLTAAVSSGLFLVALALTFTARRTGSLKVEMAALWITCYWMVSYALPYFGEVP